MKPKFKDPEVIKVESTVDGVSCDGGGGALGHPKVWYTLDGTRDVECMYCDRVFIQK